MEPIEHPATMKPRAGSAPGLETDGEGNVIPFERRTAEDRAAARGEGGKNPDHEAEIPAPMPEGARDAPQRPRNDDPAGQQGGTQGGGRDWPAG